MVDEVLAALEVRPGGRYIDCTVGEGGHALAVLSSVEPAPRLLGMDLDAQALSVARERLGRFGEKVSLAHGSFADLDRLANEHGFQRADGVLFDFGVSALQIESDDRGFSFSRPGRLDMRFDRRQKLTAHDLVNKRTERELADIIFRFGEEPRARRVARGIVQARPVATGTELAGVIARVTGASRRLRTHPATRTFQALRIAVNRELENIRAGLDQAVEVLAKGGRVVAISYHSLEDRLVKRFMTQEASSCTCPPGAPQCVCGHSPTLRLVTRRVTRPSAEEVGSNPRARSARLRVAERL